ncbi:nitrate ABC transporter ATP-binding protein [Domibacillus antri]|uniref:Nitrate ABC transporter ATP-binding protein n=1 Tax=Domibacillus antri TaxID=1714264 RepID=A0A1Q8Q8D4_9BACI|nr:ABC transporter ATP-binding protein [Domibacillus antri]OLN23545.1 nitrate ABC transporter ATP-binding protein [Domibacillus antri]
MSFLTIKDGTYGYQGKEPILHGINWEIEKGGFHCLLGKSGCGKTTLLKLAAGLLKPDSGHIYLHGKEMTEPSHECGFVFQSPTLLEWKTVMDNVLLPLSLRRKLTGEDREHAASILELIGLSEHLNRYPAQLSGGQQSRVALARALIQHPSMLFLDEPFAALDAITREELQDDLLKICQLHNTTVLFITHDIAEAVYLSDRVAVMDQGRIIHAEDVNLAKPRTMKMRYDPYFNELCLQLRQIMSGEPS